MKYRFTQFGNLEIEPTETEINFDSLITYPRSSTFSVEVFLIAKGFKYSHTFLELDYVGALTDEEISSVIETELIRFQIE